jgi:hypothetical protein
MSEKLKSALLIFAIVLITSCSAGRKSRTVSREITPLESEYAGLISSVRENNITGQGLILKKGRIELRGTEIEGSFSLNARLNKRGDFFASVKGPLGIELVRIVSVGNDIAVIDRINKTIYEGKKDIVMKRLGLPDDVFRIIFGDLPQAGVDRISYVSGREMGIILNEGDYTSNIRLSLDEMKVTGEEIEKEGMESRKVLIQFSDFRISEKRKYASVINMEEKSGMFHVKLYIDDMVTDTDSDIVYNLPSYNRQNL